MIYDIIRTTCLSYESPANKSGPCFKGAYRALVDPEAVGLGVTAFIGIVQGADSEVEDIVTSMSDFPEIDSCYFLAGAESFLLKVRVPSIAELEQLIVWLNRISWVSSTRTTTALSTKWESRPPTIPAE